MIENQNYFPLGVKKTKKYSSVILVSLVTKLNISLVSIYSKGLHLCCILILKETVTVNTAEEYSVVSHKGQR